jgi:hypothetical protein
MLELEDAARCRRKAATWSTIPIAIHTCQRENSPLEIAKSPVIFRSANKRHPPSAQAVKATGVSSEDASPVA